MYRLLIVDDDPCVLKIMEKVVLMLNHEVVSAHSGEDALKIVKGLEGAFDLVITDVVMPGLSGIEFARLAHEDYPNLKIVFISGAIPNGNALPQRSTLILKPFSPFALAKTIQEELQRCSSSKHET